MANSKSQSSSTQQEALHWSFWLGVSFFVLVIFAICYLGWAITERLSSEESAPITSVVIRVKCHIPTNKT